MGPTDVNSLIVNGPIEPFKVNYACDEIKGKGNGFMGNFTFFCSPPIEGRFVTVQKLNTEMSPLLEIREIIVFQGDAYYKRKIYVSCR